MKPSANQRPPHRRELLLGSRRDEDPPLTTRACADWMGVDPSFIRGLIHDRQLRAERVIVGGRRPFYRIFFRDFTDCLKRIGWSRVPLAGPDGLL